MQGHSQQRQREKKGAVPKVCSDSSEPQIRSYRPESDWAKRIPRLNQTGVAGGSGVGPCGKSLQGRTEDNEGV